MKRRRHLLVIDPIAFKGGSKIATESILQLLDDKRVRITVATADQDSWHDIDARRFQLWQPAWLIRREQGLLYFLRHLIIAIHLLWIRCRTGRFDVALGASSPGIDLALYIVQFLLRFSIVQLVHGPVPQSRISGRALVRAQQVYFLESARPTLVKVLSTVVTDPDRVLSRFHVLTNGLPEQVWPSRCQGEAPIIFWAASLLRWKGLDLLLAALAHIPVNERPETHICYIRPQQINLPVSEAPMPLSKVIWHESPANLDQLRACASIFVSTSTNEPFGLSILEALAAGLCVLIPEDGAYWDKILIDDFNCIKYILQDADDLAVKLQGLQKDMARVRRIGAQAVIVADDYRAERQYAALKQTLESDNLKTTAATHTKQPEGIP